MFREAVNVEPDQKIVESYFSPIKDRRDRHSMKQVRRWPIESDKNSGIKRRLTFEEDKSEED